MKAHLRGEDVKKVACAAKKEDSYKRLFGKFYSWSPDTLGEPCSVDLACDGLLELWFSDVSEIDMFIKTLTDFREKYLESKKLKKPEDNMNKYIGTKLIEAEPINRGDYYKCRGWKLPEGADPDAAGYRVKYSDSYESWSPKEPFEKAYMPVQKNEEMRFGVSIGPQMVEDFIGSTEVMTLGENTTVVRCVLKNGFVIVESSSCVDPENYSEEIGYNICMEKVRNEVWKLLGFLLQTAWHGIR